IERDGKDPHLLANLSKLGPVSVQHAATTRRTADQVADIYRARDISEQQALSSKPIQNHLMADALSELLDDRKLAASRADIEQIARRYAVDMSVLESLVRFVNTPSVGEGTVVRTMNNENGQEKITMKVGRFCSSHLEDMNVDILHRRLCGKNRDLKIDDTHSFKRTSIRRKFVLIAKKTPSPVSVHTNRIVTVKQPRQRGSA
ncbi:hypothetical protein M422DRAFT_168942, partial [Sphaerobolus stellatus SS14]